MRFATRTFLWSFLPFVILLLGSFWAIQRLVEHTVRDSLRSSLRQTHVSVARVRSKSELQNSRFLKILGENPALKAGLQLLLAESRPGAVREEPRGPREVRLQARFNPSSSGCERCRRTARSF